MYLLKKKLNFVCSIVKYVKTVPQLCFGIYQLFFWV